MNMTLLHVIASVFCPPSLTQIPPLLRQEISRCVVALKFLENETFVSISFDIDKMS